MSGESIITLIVSVTTLIVAGITLKVNAKAKNITNDMNNHDINRYNKEVDSKAKEFISKYNKRTTEFDIPQINKLPLCLMSNMFNSTYGYKNQMYTDYNNLSADVQKRVLEIRNLSVFTIYGEISYDYLYTRLLLLTNEKYKELFNIVSNDSDNTLIDTYLQTEKIDRPDQIYYAMLIAKSFENNEFSKIIELFKNKNISQNTLRYMLCLITQEIVKYSIDESNRQTFMNLQQCDVDYIYGDCIYEDLFLHTILIWYICIDII